MLRFTIRDVLWLTVVVALSVGWWLDHHGPPENSGRSIALGPPTDVEVIHAWARQAGKDAALILSEFKKGRVKISKKQVASYRESSAGAWVEHAHYRCGIEYAPANLNDTVFIQRTYPLK